MPATKEKKPSHEKGPGKPKKPPKPPKQPKSHLPASGRSHGGSGSSGGSSGNNVQTVDPGVTGWPHDDTPTVKDLLAEILDAIQNLNIMPDDGPSFTLWLRRMQRFRILRDLYYPNFQQEWG